MVLLRGGTGSRHWLVVQPNFITSFSQRRNVGGAVDLQFQVEVSSFNSAVVGRVLNFLNFRHRPRQGKKEKKFQAGNFSKKQQHENPNCEF